MDERGYAISRSLGTGASSEVFLVRNSQERQFVLKRLSVSSVEEFVQETEIFRSLPRHPCVVELKETFVDSNKFPCLVLEYCEAGDLHSFLVTRATANIPISEICGLDWTLEILFGLNFLHAHKIVYRDLKALNVFMVRAKNQYYADGQRKYVLKLGDFGVSRRLQSKKEMLTTQIGTPIAFSPEIFLSQPYSFKNDIWGMGVLCYQIFHGTSPFEADTFLGVRKKVLYDKPASMNADLDIETRKLIHSLLVKDPNKRPDTREIFRSPPLVQRLVQVLDAYGSLNRESQGVLVRQLCEQGLKDLVPHHLYANAYEQVLHNAVNSLRIRNAS